MGNSKSKSKQARISLTKIQVTNQVIYVPFEDMMYLFLRVFVFFICFSFLVWGDSPYEESIYSPLTIFKYNRYISIYSHVL